MKIFIGADHGGFELKEKLKLFISNLGHEIIDEGANEFNSADDYPDFIIPVSRNVVNNPGSLGIVLGRSGNGEAIAANKIKGARTALCISAEHARKAKKDNDANILSLGADFIEENTAEEIVKTFIDTPFSNEERHIRRLNKIKEIEN